MTILIKHLIWNKKQIISNKKQIIWNKKQIIWNKKQIIWNKKQIIWNKKQIVWNKKQIIWNKKTKYFVFFSEGGRVPPLFETILQVISNLTPQKVVNLQLFLLSGSDWLRIENGT